MRGLLVAVLLLLGVSFVIVHVAQGQALLLTLRSGLWYWVAAALALQAAALANRALIFQALYRFFGTRLDLRYLFNLVLAGAFVGIVAPGGALAGTVVLVQNAAARGMPLSRALMVTFLYFLLDYAGFTMVLLSGLLILLSSHQLTSVEVAAAAVILVTVAAGIGVLVCAYRAPAALPRAAVRLLASLRRLPRWVRPPWQDADAAQFATGLADAVRAVARHPVGLGRAAGHALAVEACSLAALWAVFEAFRFHLPFPHLVSAYAVGLLFTIVSFTPSGIGIVEPLMTATLGSLGTPVAVAALATFVYRGISLWVPFLAGFAGMRVFRAAPSPRADIPRGPGHG
jgi:uncharacterized protein (TIRG00374 family)